MLFLSKEFDEPFKAKGIPGADVNPASNYLGRRYLDTDKHNLWELITTTVDANVWKNLTVPPKTSTPTVTGPSKGWEKMPVVLTISNYDTGAVYTGEASNGTVTFNGNKVTYTSNNLIEALPNEEVLIYAKTGTKQISKPFIHVLEINAIVNDITDTGDGVNDGELEYKDTSLKSDFLVNTTPYDARIVEEDEITAGRISFKSTKYTGNSGELVIKNNIPMNLNGKVVDKFGGQVLIKNRDIAGTHGTLKNTLSGGDKTLFISGTNAEAALYLLTFKSNGFNINSTSNYVNANNHVAWSHRTTKYTNGYTNHGKYYEVEFNPESGFVQGSFIGSGQIDHEIPHMMGITGLDFVVVKAVESPVATNWIVGVEEKIPNRLVLNTNAFGDGSYWDSTTFNSDKIKLRTIASGQNNVNEKHYFYGFANTAGKVKVGTYKGTASVGNKITGLGFKPAYLMVKRVDGTDDWVIFDSKRNKNDTLDHLAANSTDEEADWTTSAPTFDEDGFTMNSITATNVFEGTYLYIAIADHDDFETTLYKGNGGTQDIVTGLNMDTKLETEEIANGDYSLPLTTGWSYKSGTTTFAVVDEKLVATNTAIGTTGLLEQTLTLEKGKTYKISVEEISSSGTRSGVTVVHNDVIIVSLRSDDPDNLGLSTTFVAETSMLLYFWQQNTGVAIFGKVSVKEVSYPQIPGGLSWFKNIANGASDDSHVLQDTVRGEHSQISSNSTASASANATQLTKFNTDGFSVGNSSNVNGSGISVINWSWGTTHKYSGITNHNKPYTCAWDHESGFVIIKYKGSGIAGHEVPHHLGKSLDFLMVKGITFIEDWRTFDKFSGAVGAMRINQSAIFGVSDYYWNNTAPNDRVVTLGTDSPTTNKLNEEFILYGWVNTKAQEVLTYKGNGKPNKFVKTNGRPTYLLFKGVDIVSNWVTKDKVIGFDKELYANSNGQESSNYNVKVYDDGFLIESNHSDLNTLDKEYIVLAMYEDNEGSTISYDPSKEAVIDVKPIEQDDGETDFVQLKDSEVEFNAVFKNAVFDNTYITSRFPIENGQLLAAKSYETHPTGIVRGYKGTGVNNSLDLGIGFIDFTKNNGIGVRLDKSGGLSTFGDFKDDNDNIITEFDITLPKDKFIGKFDFKNIDTEYIHINFDSFRGVGYNYLSYDTNKEVRDTASTNSIISYDSKGLTVDVAEGINGLNDNYSLNAENYTHVKGGVKNGVKWVYAYNPISGAYARIREGSDDVIEHYTHGKSVYQVTKRLDEFGAGVVYYGDKEKYLELYSVTGDVPATLGHFWNKTEPTDNTFTFKGSDVNVNRANNVFVDYGFVETKTRVTGTFTGKNTPQFIDCGFKPDVVVVKRLNTTGDWVQWTSVTGDTKFLYLNTNGIATTATHIETNKKGFMLTDNWANTNLLGSTYFYYAYSYKPVKTPKAERIGNFYNVTKKKVKCFAVKAYTGKEGNQTIETGIPSVDFTEANNGSGYWFDRSVNKVKTDAGNVAVYGDIAVNTSKIEIKSCDDEENWLCTDGIRGNTKRLFLNLTDPESDALHFTFENNGIAFTDAGSTYYNTIDENYVLYQTGYTRVKWGLTNHNKLYLEAYNPGSKENMIYYNGSGQQGHCIPHSLGVKLDYIEIRALESTVNWIAEISSGRGSLSTNIDLTNNRYTDFHDDSIELKETTTNINSTDAFIMYGKAKSNNWTIVKYKGTGKAGNFIPTKGIDGKNRRPRRVITKLTSSISSWQVTDSERGQTSRIYLDRNSAEVTDPLYNIDFLSSGMSIDDTGANSNADGGEYIAKVEFSTEGDGGDSYYDEYTAEHNLGDMTDFNPSEVALVPDLKWSFKDGEDIVAPDLVGKTITYDTDTKLHKVTLGNITDLTGGRKITGRLSFKTDGTKVKSFKTNIQKKGI